MEVNQQKYTQIPAIIYFVLLAVLSLLAGAFIYITLRPNEAIFISWIKSLGADEFLFSIRNVFQFDSSEVSKLVIYSLPDFLWAFAYSLLIIKLWWKSNSLLKYLWLLTIPTLVFGYELLQINQVLPGTFCWLDIVAGLLGIALAAILAGFPFNTKSFKNNKLKTK